MGTGSLRLEQSVHGINTINHEGVFFPLLEILPILSIGTP